MTQDSTKSNVFTSRQTRRWIGLSTLWVLVYGLGFPIWVWLSTVEGLGFSVSLEMNGFLLSVLVAAWFGTVAYVIGPESVMAYKEYKDAGSSGGT